MQVIKFIEEKTGKSLYELANQAGVRRQALYRLRDANAPLCVKLIIWLLGQLTPADRGEALQLLGAEPWPAKKRKRKQPSRRRS
jgi:hypothetical protein